MYQVNKFVNLFIWNTFYEVVDVDEQAGLFIF